jgi:hypothetical protein
MTDTLSLDAFAGILGPKGITTDPDDIAPWLQRLARAHYQGHGRGDPVSPC